MACLALIITHCLKSLHRRGISLHPCFNSTVCFWRLPFIFFQCICMMGMLGEVLWSYQLPTADALHGKHVDFRSIYLLQQFLLCTSQWWWSSRPWGSLVERWALLVWQSNPSGNHRQLTSKHQLMLLLNLLYGKSKTLCTVLGSLWPFKLVQFPFAPVLWSSHSRSSRSQSSLDFGCFRESCFDKKQHTIDRKWTRSSICLCLHIQSHSWKWTFSAIYDAGGRTLMQVPVTQMTRGYSNLSQRGVPSQCSRDILAAKCICWCQWSAQRRVF